MTSLRDMLYSHPSPSKMVMRLVMLSGCIVVCSVLIAVLHIPASNKPALIFFAAIPAFMVVSSEVFGLKAKNKTSSVSAPSVAEAGTSAVNLAEFERLRVSVDRLTNAQQELAKSISIGQQGLAKNVAEVIRVQTEQAKNDQKAFSQLFADLMSLKEETILLEQPEDFEERPKVSQGAVRRRQLTKDEMAKIVAKTGGSQTGSTQLYGIIGESVARLTEREKQVLAAIRSRKTRSEIAEELHVPLFTVSRMLKLLRKKIRSQTTEAVLERERAEEK